MDIRSALDRLVAIEKDIAITEPARLAVKRAYKYFPPQSVAVPDLPCFMNSWTLVEERRGISLREQRYTVNIQFFAGEGDQDYTADVASAFMAAFMDALDADVSLGGAVTDSDLRGGNPTLAILERAGRSYIGLNLFLDLTMKDAVSFA